MTHAEHRAFELIHAIADWWRAGDAPLYGGALILDDYCCIADAVKECSDILHSQSGQAA
jgi:hypothetical protein